MLPPPLNKLLSFAAFFFSWKRSDEAKRRQTLARNKRKRLEIKQIKKNAYEEQVQGKKKRQTTKEKLSSAKTFTCKFTWLWCAHSCNGFYTYSVSSLPFFSVTRTPAQCKADIFFVYFNTKIGLRWFKGVVNILIFNRKFTGRELAFFTMFYWETLKCSFFFSNS